MSDDAAYILFGGDRPANQGQPAAAPQAPAPQAAQRQTDAQPHTGDDAAAKLFDSEAQAGDNADYSGAFDKLDDLAASLKLTGEAERSVQLSEATDAMFEDAIAWGTPPDTVREISGYLHEAAGTMGEMSPEALADGQARSLKTLAEAGVTEADLNIARSMVKSLEGRIPNLSDQLIRSGLGNDVRLIQSLIREGKRRSTAPRR